MRVAMLIVALLLAWARPATAEERYEPQKAGHPLRVTAYFLHPVGVVLDYLIFRPAWYIGGIEPIRTLVGRERSVEEIFAEAEAEAAQTRSAP